MANKFTNKTTSLGGLRGSLGTSISSLMENMSPITASASATNPLYPSTNASGASKYDTSSYDALYDEFAKQQSDIATKQKAETADEYNSQLKQAYINRMQNQKALNENLVRAGIRGGATETANLNLLTNYQNTRNSLNEQKMKALRDIDDNANTNIFNYKQQNDAAKRTYIEQREAEDRQRAQTMEDNAIARQEAREAEERARQDALAAEERARQDTLAAEAKAKKEANAAAKKAAQADYWTAKYAGWYKIENLNKAYKRAATVEEKTIIKARIGYLKQQKKGY